MLIMGYAFRMSDKMMVGILTSVDKAEQAEWIIQQLLEKRLAACVQQTFGTSTYRWQGKLECSQEYYLHIKTSPDLKEQVMGWLAEHHPYEIPEIIVIEGECRDDYWAWLHSSLLT
jgi:periplasmic divalent cation tolerance protein